MRKKPTNNQLKLASAPAPGSEILNAYRRAEKELSAALSAKISQCDKLLSLACVAKQLCEWTRSNAYPKEMTTEFIHLTELVDQLDTEVRRVFPNTQAERR